MSSDLPFVCFSVSTADSAFKQWKKTQETVNEIGSKHVLTMAELIRYQPIL